MEADSIRKKRDAEKELVGCMIRVYCHRNHKELWKAEGKRKDYLCTECKELSDYAAMRSEKCPHMETKTFCSCCKTHCYKPDMKQKIKEVMRYSGPRMLFHHPVLAVKHVIEEKKAKAKDKASAERGKTERVKSKD